MILLESKNRTHLNRFGVEDSRGMTTLHHLTKRRDQSSMSESQLGRIHNASALFKINVVSMSLLQLLPKLLLLESRAVEVKGLVMMRLNSDHADLENLKVIMPIPIYQYQQHSQRHKQQHPVTSEIKASCIIYKDAYEPVFRTRARQCNFLSRFGMIQDF